MPYLLIDDGMAENPKIAGLSDKAFRLWITSLLYCARNLTNGAISEIAIRSLAPICQIAKPLAVVRALVEAGLFEKTDTGWVIHDYLDYNPSRADLSEKRRLSRERQKKYRGKGSRVTERVTGRVSNAWQDPTKGSSKEDPLGSSPTGSQGNGTIAAAEAAARTWETPDSDAFAQHLDQIAHDHRTPIGSVERERLWDIALTNMPKPA